MSTTEKKRKRNRGRLVRDTERERPIRYRVERLYGMHVDFKLLDDDEYRDLEELSARVLRTVPKDDYARDPGLARRRQKAEWYVNEREKLLTGQPQWLQDRYRPGNERVAEFVRNEGRVPDDTEMAAVEAGTAPPASFRILGERPVHDVIDRDVLNEEETMRLEQLVAAAAGKPRDWFEKARFKAKLAELVARIDEPKPFGRKRQYPGQVVIPRDALLGLWGVDLAVLTAIVGAFENPDSIDPNRAHFDEDADGVRTLVFNDWFMPTNWDAEERITPTRRYSFERLREDGWIEMPHAGQLRLGQKYLDSVEASKGPAKPPPAKQQTLAERVAELEAKVAP